MFGLRFPIYAGRYSRTINKNVVRLIGITHIIIEEDKYFNYNENELKDEAVRIIKDYKLINEEAVGVMFKKDSFIRPIVYVRDIRTLYYETACGSGTTAVGLFEAYLQNKNIDLNIIQPSGMIINVKVTIKNNEFIKAIISGEVKELKL